AHDEDFALSRAPIDDAARERLLQAEPDPRAEALMAAVALRGARSVPLRWLLALGGHPRADAVLAALTTTVAWGPLQRKRISRTTIESLPAWMRL
ncbi:CoA-binding protein, partial [Denitromonas sp. IR12]|nr:CoA-binding protein [Denitromonas iodatirespirans]